MAAHDAWRVELDGVFDRQAVVRLGDALRWVRPGADVDVDLTRVRELQDACLGPLARVLEQHLPGHRIRVRGLHERQLRLLRYLGVSLGGPAEPLDDGPAEAEPALEG